jgi:shikimate dehydrogenase
MKKFGLIGRSLEHSFSKSFFERYFEGHSILASYENIELSEIDEIQTVISNGYSGLNVTIPYKEQIIPFLDELSEEALKIGAVNVVEFKNGKTIGHNTDVYGFRNSIKPFLNNHHDRAIIFGTGGASKAVEFVLKNLGIDVIFISRNPKGENQFSYEDVNEHMTNACKLWVNTTPVGTHPNNEDVLPIPFNFLTEHHFLIDLIYNPEKTVFLQEGEKKGAMIQNGHSMLKHQATKAWEIWTLNESN